MLTLSVIGMPSRANASTTGRGTANFPKASKSRNSVASVVRMRPVHSSPFEPLLDRAACGFDWVLSVWAEFSTREGRLFVFAIDMLDLLEVCHRRRGSQASGCGNKN